ncbi:MAG: CDP-diacylglycerol--glycerol-3-phosphate 3-phosphatidyltransferase [Verrucomicrobia bacterium]|nr:MAG: CDP-diacylglycerol--glycerol-3-phosphate 3-phosphatidyltransferase [Verrucomicrobiota bacterium]
MAQPLVAKHRLISHIVPVNLPNTITLCRLVLTAVFVGGAALQSATGHWIALVAFVVAAISDWFDGYFARKYALVTPLGRLLDPVADKVLVCAAFVYLSAQGRCPVWVTVLIVAREFLITGLRQIAIEAGQVLSSDHLGKWKTGLQLGYCITCLVWFAVMATAGSTNPALRFLYYLSTPGGWLMPGFLWLALTLTVVSGWNYMWANRALLTGKRR